MARVALREIKPWAEASRHLPAATYPERPYNAALNQLVSLFAGDITSLEVDAIVNAANSSLLGGGGVDGAIHRRAGRLLLDECRTLHGCATGDAKITRGYQLPAKHVIHTVGPTDCSVQALRSCYLRSLHLMRQNNLRTIAFPCISTGVYGYPQEGAARLATLTVRQWLEEADNARHVDRVIFCVFLEADRAHYQRELAVYFPNAPVDAIYDESPFPVFDYSGARPNKLPRTVRAAPAETVDPKMVVAEMMNTEKVAMDIADKEADAALEAALNEMTEPAISADLKEQVAANLTSEQAPSADGKAEPAASKQTEPALNTDVKVEAASEHKIEPALSTDGKADPTSEPKIEPVLNADVKADPIAEPMAEPALSTEAKAAELKTAALSTEGKADSMMEPALSTEGKADSMMEPVLDADAKAEPADLKTEQAISADAKEDPVIESAPSADATAEAPAAQ